MTALSLCRVYLFEAWTTFLHHPVTSPNKWMQCHHTFLSVWKPNRPTSSQTKELKEILITQQSSSAPLPNSLNTNTTKIETLTLKSRSGTNLQHRGSGSFWRGPTQPQNLALISRQNIWDTCWSCCSRDRDANVLETVGFVLLLTVSAVCKKWWAMWVHCSTAFKPSFLPWWVRWPVRDVTLELGTPFWCSPCVVLAPFSCCLCSHRWVVSVH